MSRITKVKEVDLLTQYERILRSFRKDYYNDFICLIYTANGPIIGPELDKVYKTNNYIHFIFKKFEPLYKILITGFSIIDDEDYILVKRNYIEMIPIEEDEVFIFFYKIELPSFND